MPDSINKIISMTAQEAGEMVHQFEAGTLPKEQWTHKAHFIMALWYCAHQPLPVAMQSIKEGIKKYNISVGGVNTDDAGYHETITVFYTRLIVNFLFQANDGSGFETLLPALDKQPFLAKDFPLQYYTRERLMSKEARKSWMEPDKQPLR